ncbi:venom serine carboxypeptidase-like [Microplitis mediator]|uniref:venom serine carboxypeptidase-like n=1 Tax=Microplitis mediator TaxID=375433 RepID=UPI0025537F46|nr:venom serine carboxypeptidase-like [Microplitis mediator]
MTFNKIITISGVILIITIIFPCGIRFFVYTSNDSGDIEPLFLTPYIDDGRFDEAKKLAAVNYEKMPDIESYAGYLTVNKKYNSNLFFWLFSAEINPRDAPTILWLQGGPGISSLAGAFFENGPFIFGKNKTLKINPYRWSISHNVIYIDSPVGTGYSFTDNEEGFSKNETQVYEDLYAGLVQFFKLFSELQSNDLYIAGESYSGKSIPGFSYTIHKKNPTAEIKINLKGLAIGNGYLDPINQFNYGDYLYQIGVVDFNGREKFDEYEKKAVAFMNKNEHNNSVDIFDELFIKSPSLLMNLTGSSFIFNYLIEKGPDLKDILTEWMRKTDLHRAIHVGSVPFEYANKTVGNYLRHEFTESHAHTVAALLPHYKVLLYNGQVDIIVPYPFLVNFIQKLQWPGADDYKKAQRNIWRVNGQVAGYVKIVHNLIEVLVRNAGHLVPTDQPEWALDLITQFTHHQTVH